MPPVDITETDTNIILHVDVPGLKKEDISLRIEGNDLIVSGERTSQKVEEKQNIRRTERETGRFTRQFTLPNNINSESINAVLSDGVLEIKLEKLQAPQHSGRMVSIEEKK